MTLVMSPAYHPEHHNMGDLLALLDECQKRGIRMIICDSRAYWSGASTDEAGYRARFAAALKDFGSHPAVFGFHIGDEPFAKDEADCAAAYRIQREMAPELVPFLNHLPWHSDVNLCLDTDNYGQWLERFIRKSGTKLLCYDCYTQMNPGTQGIEVYIAGSSMDKSRCMGTDSFSPDRAGPGGRNNTDAGQHSSQSPSACQRG